MKKILSLLFCLFILLGCNKKGKVVDMSSSKVTSMDELNSIVNGRISKLYSREVDDETYSVEEREDGKIAVYTFKVGDTQYTVKFSSTIMPKDISGIMENEKPVFDEDYNDVRATGEGYKLARWFTVDGQYVLIVPSDLDDYVYDAILNELAEMSIPKES